MLSERLQNTSSADKLFEKLERLSFTDCTIVAFMKTFNIKSLATFDKEFKKIKEIQVVD